MVPSGIIHQYKWKCVYLLKKQNKIQKRKKKKGLNFGNSIIDGPLLLGVLALDPTSSLCHAGDQT